ncbi:MAG: hypothetical protein VX938_14045 [Myxococcota bacterium]|nr:hypothetical protein [Myxococcota bacterium]MEE2780252.1 hypothetical protein [Myxococcota bacterium]
MWNRKNKAKDADRESMNAMLDDGSCLNSVTFLKLEASCLVTDSEIELAAGTSVTLYPIGQSSSAEIFELQGIVRGALPDIMVSAFAQNRYLLTIDLDLSPRQREILAREISSARSANDPHTRPFTEPHREGLFDQDIRDQIGPTMSQLE